MSSEPVRQSSTATAVVLVVEDHETSAEGYAQLLSGVGYRVVRAKNGYEALAEVARAAPSIILLDLKLPKLDGWDLLSRLKADPPVSSVPIVVITGDSLPTHHEMALSRGAAAVLSKPIDPAQLLAIIREHLSAPSIS